jgi:hypothetical protein
MFAMQPFWKDLHIGQVFMRRIDGLAQGIHARTERTKFRMMSISWI